MAIEIESRTRVSAEDDWGDWAVTTSTATLVDTSLIEYRAKPVYDIPYLEEYITVYEQLVETSLISQGPGKESILTKQFALLDANKGQLTLKEIAAAKNAAYGNLRAQIMTNSQKTAMAIIEKKYRFDKELEQLDFQLELMGHQVDKAEGDAAYVAAQKTAMEEQVVDNRKIKALDSLADTYGTFGAGGLTVSSDMWEVYFSIVDELATTTFGGSSTGSTV